MVVFVDTSAFYALMTLDDPNHRAALAQWDIWQKSDEIPGLQTSNYVVLETISLIQNRLGLEAVRSFQGEIIPLITIQWATDSLHAQGVATLLAAKRRRLSLVDCMSFVIMRHFGIDTAFAFDRHFTEEGFHLYPNGV